MDLVAIADLRQNLIKSDVAHPKTFGVRPKRLMHGLCHPSNGHDLCNLSLPLKHVGGLQEGLNSPNRTLATSTYFS